MIHYNIVTGTFLSVLCAWSMLIAISHHDQRSRVVHFICALIYGGLGTWGLLS